MHLLDDGTVNEMCSEGEVIFEGRSCCRELQVLFLDHETTTSFSNVFPSSSWRTLVDRQTMASELERTLLRRLSTTQRVSNRLFFKWVPSIKALSLSPSYYWGNTIFQYSLRFNEMTIADSVHLLESLKMRSPKYVDTQCRIRTHPILDLHHTNICASIRRWWIEIHHLHTNAKFPCVTTWIFEMPIGSSATYDPEMSLTVWRLPRPDWSVKEAEQQNVSVGSPGTPQTWEPRCDRSNNVVGISTVNSLLFFLSNIWKGLTRCIVLVHVHAPQHTPGLNCVTLWHATLKRQCLVLCVLSVNMALFDVMVWWWERRWLAIDVNTTSGWWLIVASQD
jgi:hypothetical protein